MKQTFLMIKSCFTYVGFVVILILVVAYGNKINVVNTEDISNVRSIQAIHLVSKYNKKIVKTKYVNDFNDVLKYASKMPTKFEGIMTGYGPDCEGCGGKTGCPPRQDVRNGNVSFKDQEYGKVNIVATDSRIPCGSIIKITNSSLGKEITAIALDRGGVIKGTKMDFLVATEAIASNKVGKQSVTYEIVRWGW